VSIIIIPAVILLLSVHSIILTLVIDEMCDRQLHELLVINAQYQLLLQLGPKAVLLGFVGEDII